MIEVDQHHKKNIQSFRKESPIKNFYNEIIATNNIELKIFTIF